MDRQDQEKKCQVSCTWWAYTAWYCDARIEWIGKIKKRNVKLVVPSGPTQHGTVMLG